MISQFVNVQDWPTDTVTLPGMVPLMGPLLQVLPVCPPSSFGSQSVHPVCVRSNSNWLGLLGSGVPGRETIWDVSGSEMPRTAGGALGFTIDEIERKSTGRSSIGDSSGTKSCRSGRIDYEIVADHELKSVVMACLDRLAIGNSHGPGEFEHRVVEVGGEGGLRAGEDRGAAGRQKATQRVVSYPLPLTGVTGKAEGIPGETSGAGRVGGRDGERYIGRAMREADYRVAEAGLFK